MASEIRVNKINNRAGLGTITIADTGVVVNGIVTCTEVSGLNVLNIAGVSTFANTLDINGDIDVDGHTNLDNLSVAGVSTFSDNITLNGGLVASSSVSAGQILVGSGVTIESNQVATGQATFTGIVTASSFRGDGSQLTGVTSVGGNTGVDFNDNVKVRLGTGNDLEIYYDGTDGWIKNVGKLKIESTNDQIEVRGDIIYLRNRAANQNYFYAANNAFVGLTYAGDMRLETESTGIKFRKRLDPETDSAVDLGTNAKRWRNIYADTYYGDGSNLTGITGTTINNNAANRIITGSGSANTLNGNTYATWNGNNLALRGGEGENCTIELASDEGDDNADFWRMMAQASDNALAIDHYGSGSWVEKLRITSAGSVYHTGGGNNRRYSFASDGTAHYLSFDNTLNGIKLNGYGGISFETNGTNERARIDGSGNFIIGSTSAEAKLDVTGGVSISSNGVTVSPSGYDLKIRSNTGKLGIHIDNSSGTPTLEFGTGNATTGGAITTNSYGIFLKPGGADKLKVEPDGVRSFATFVDTSYHANPDPLGDGSGIAYYRLNYNFQDSGRFGQHGTSIQGGDPTFALVNSSGEPCWNNPADGAINVPNLKNSYPFSMAAWINLSSWPTTTNNDLIMNLSIGGQRVSLCIVCWSGTNYSDFSIMYGGTDHWVFAPTSRPTNQWIHVVYSVVGSANSGHAIYQNGTALSATNRGGGHGGGAGWAIGGNAGNSERFAIGRIGSIRFFNKALSSSEASALYTNDTFYT